MDVSYQNYKYHIATPPFNDYHPIHDRLIPYWKKLWSQLLGELSSTGGLCENELYWQDRVTFITHDQHIVAIHFLANYPIDEFIESEYVKRYLRMPIKDSVKNSKNRPVNTLQYFSVNPDYNYRKTGINFTNVLKDLSILHHREMNSRNRSSVIRKPLEMHNMACKVGFREYYAAGEHDAEVSVMSNPRPKRLPMRSVTQVSDFLWNNREFIRKQEYAA